MPINYDEAGSLLDTILSESQGDVLQGVPANVSQEFASAVESVFRSRTQAFREVLLGSIVARIQDDQINIRRPYVSQGDDAYSGRSLDERVINPFLKSNRIPSSQGPYLSVFRRSVEFDDLTREGVRDKDAYDQFGAAMGYIENTSEDSGLRTLLRYVLYRFLELREESNIPLSQIHRISLEQFRLLIAGLLETPSGGRLPLLLVVATFAAIKDYFALDWHIESQGINVADAASGAGGDVTISRGNQTIMAAEVTERPVDLNRVVTTFQTKIAPNGIEDYLFFVRPNAPTSDAETQARQYFAQGHEVNFLVISDWIFMVLATIGTQGRAMFVRTLLGLFDSSDVPATLKVAWNEQVQRITATGS